MDLLDRATAAGLWTPEKITLVESSYTADAHFQYCTSRDQEYLYDDPRGYSLPLAAETLEKPVVVPTAPPCEEGDLFEVDQTGSAMANETNAETTTKATSKIGGGCSGWRGKGENVAAQAKLSSFTIGFVTLVVFGLY